MNRFRILQVVLLLTFAGCSPSSEANVTNQDEVESPVLPSPAPLETQSATSTSTPDLPVQTSTPTISPPDPTATATATELPATPPGPFSIELIAPGQEKAFSFQSSSGEEIQYWFYLPENYAGNQEWPLLISLHGFLGFDSSLEKVRGQYPPAWVSPDTEFPFIVIAPQAPSGSWAKYHQPMEELIQTLSEYISIDPDAHFLTGLSAGTIGVWQWALAYPDRFKGIAPIAGGLSMNPGDPVLDTICELEDLPVWVAHSEGDQHVPIGVSREVVAALEACGNSLVRFTIYPDLNHMDSISRAYAGPELYDWMLELIR
ncbi:MAG: hypothetical protein JSV42_10745 [Chloroflexota bacterium]|nr:MAG: hypothetical protein JSV42_10745 [Chloroflexota bacterium]